LGLITENPPLDTQKLESPKGAAKQRNNVGGRRAFNTCESTPKQPEEATKTDRQSKDTKDKELEVKH